MLGYFLVCGMSKKQNPELAKLVAEIDRFRQKHNMKPSTFGVMALKDPRLLQDIANGRELRWQTIQTIRDNMKAYK